ncbi:hypothetical protein EXU85_00650 [Spirosoma sp. KCTC 42546]|uniref:hypothetical protein n=1 Tax=Spirosoma sp. KCTC 42546 TaxID=2520506 RepID=UPI001159CE28|nr:hypothetical protein [Spirosoma sp. KCTC 42546]QDK77180.1 hypothetical protein EXU85_00650 [Spirosoma sp. KCTC 42546]
MFETILNLVRQHAGQSVVNNSAIPNEKNDTVLQTVTSSIMNGLGQQAQSGGLGSLLGMVTGQGGSVDDHPVSQGVQQTVQQDLMSKLGISPQVAMSVAAAIVPMVLSKLMHKANDPTDSSVDAGSLLNSLGGQGGGLGNILGGLFGGH